MATVATELTRGVLSASDLRGQLSVSRSTLMRMVRDAAPKVIQIGRGPATRYGLQEVWPNLDDSRFPIFRITEAGKATSSGELITLVARQSVWMPQGAVSDGIPSVLADARPSGFLGHRFAAIHGDLRLPPRLMDWSDNHILLAMARRGEDLPGNLIIGDESFARWQTLETAPKTRDDYTALAEATIAGHPPGSSAGGERPKFGVLVDGRHMLVKFAARGGTADVVARRWSDLLILEALALDIVGSHGITAARTNIVETSSHVFLESERFDRVGARGRIGVLSLAAVHDDPSDTWARAAAVLRRRRLITDEDARRLQWLDAFGALIGNTDRHQSNVLFFTEGSALRLAPAFDQVSMIYAPTADGQVPRRVFEAPTATGDTLDVWEDARKAAHEFWSRGRDETRLSDDIRSELNQRAGTE